MQQKPEPPKHIKGWMEKHPTFLNEEPKEAIREETARTELDLYRLSLRKYDPRRLGLPWKTKAQCPRCAKVVEAEFYKKINQVVLRFNCPIDGRIEQVHYDNIFTNLDDYLISYRGKPIQPIVHMLPRTVETLCPICNSVILGRYFVWDRIVWIEKTCPEHGYFKDKVNTDIDIYAKAIWWSFEESRGLLLPHVCNSIRCPSDCGLCDNHQSPACLANIDLTNRCNLQCPVCFANANAAGYVYEPSYDEVVIMLKRLRDYRPIPATCVQFSGGEPTLHPDFFKIIKTATDLGFSQIQIATNGIKIADEDFARKAAEAGLHTLYLQFDGVDESPYIKTRGRPLLKYKLAAIENCRKFGMKVCLVPTIIKGETDDQVPKILRFAAENIDVISGISYQPVSFTGRIDKADLENKRYTVADLAHDIAKASGADPVKDFFPLSFAVPFSELLSVLCSAPKIQPPCHPDCALGTYFWVSPEGKLYPFPQVFDIETLFWKLHLLAKKVEKNGKMSIIDKLYALWLFYKYFRKDRAPKDLTFYRMIRSLRGMVNKKVGRGKSERKNYKTLLAAGMHFQDSYNFDVQRIKRCVIHYSSPEGIFPFCTYNCGPSYRPFVEKIHAKKILTEETKGDKDNNATTYADLFQTLKGPFQG